MKILIDVFVNKESQVASAFVRQVGDNPPTINYQWDNYDAYSIEVVVPHSTEYPVIEHKIKEAS